jgi:hypothetical protein
MNVEKRNGVLRALTTKILTADDSEKALFPKEVLSDLSLVFASDKRSFREIVLTVNLARILDSSFQATEDLYASNPRPVYEQGIKPILDAHGIPCTQSGPLNVTKATKAITDQWAAMKSPKDVGLATYRVVKFIDSLDKKLLESFANLMGNLLMKDAKFIEKMAIERSPVSDSRKLHQVSSRLILGALDGGNTAQRLIGILLQLHTEFSKSDVVVRGAEDSASTTNLTSKKFGDLSVLSKTGRILSVYEVTLKIFTEQRIAECSQSLIGNLGKENIDQFEVLVLCRNEDLPSSIENVGESHILIGRFRDKFGIQYNFIDVFEWINLKLLELNDEFRLLFFHRLQAYVNRIKTPVKVKSKWAELIEELLNE